MIQLRSYDKGLCDKIDGPLVDKVTREPDRRHVILGKDGIFEPGSRIQQGNVLVNKKVPLASSLNLSLSEAHLARYQDVPVSYKHDVESFAEQVLLSSHRNYNALCLQVAFARTSVYEYYPSDPNWGLQHCGKCNSEIRLEKLGFLFVFKSFILLIYK